VSAAYNNHYEIVNHFEIFRLADPIETKLFAKINSPLDMANQTQNYNGDILPNGMIPLHTPQGQIFFEETRDKREAFIKDFKHQIGGSNCGPASLALVINTINSFQFKNFRILI